MEGQVCLQVFESISLQRYQAHISFFLDFLRA